MLRGRGVDRSAHLFPAHALLAERGFRHVRGEPLVHEPDRKAVAAFEPPGEAARKPRELVFPLVLLKLHADDERNRTPLFDERADRCEPAAAVFRA